MNIIVKTRYLLDTDKNTLFGDEDVVYVEDMPLPNLLVLLGVYPTTSKARNAGRSGEIPKGWSEIKASKKVDLWVWNPFI